MILDIKGHYRFKQDNKIILEGNNLITFYGEIFLLNRCINNNFNPLEYIVLGNARNTPLKTDIKLGNETVRQSCSKEADINTNSIILRNSFTAEDMIGITEIGVATDKFLVSHDVFEKIDNTIITNLLGTVEVEYIFTFNTSTVKSNWTPSTQYKNVYYTYEPSYVNNVIQDNIHGYTRMDTVERLEEYGASYYYDTNTRNLYIHPKQIIRTKNDGTDELIETPIEQLSISVQTKYNQEYLEDIG